MLGKKELRLALYFAQFGRCIWCGEMMQFVRKKNGGPSRDFPTFEHLIRKEDGGTMSMDNIVLAHSKCNLKRNIEHQQKRKAARKRPSQVAPGTSPGNGHPSSGAASCFGIHLDISLTRGPGCPGGEALLADGLNRSIASNEDVACGNSLDKSQPI